MRASPLATTLAAIGAAWIVIDGDTIRWNQEPIRLEGIDAAEIHHAKCEAERRLGILAKRRLEQLLGSGPVDIRRNSYPKRPDRYRRTLAHVLVAGEDVGCILIKEGYARPWTGRREDWCKSLDRRIGAEDAPSCTVTN
jgi:endonuclease YncB( thermonuclease family)